MLAATFDNLSFGQFFVAVLLAAGCSMLVYWHADKHGSKRARAWGILTFLAVGLFLPLYFIHYYATRKRF